MLAVLIYKLVLKNPNSANFTIYSNDAVVMLVSHNCNIIDFDNKTLKARNKL